MSHFTVLVAIKEDSNEALEKALQPFHEYECTGIKDEYVIFVESDESKDELLKEFEEEKESYDCFEDYIREYYGYKTIDGKIGSYTNPNRQWDWWKIGGRWSNFLINKDGTKGDFFKKSDVDFKAMEQESLKPAIENRAKALLAIGDDTFTPWSKWNLNDNIDSRRESYHAQPSVIRLKEIFDSPFHDLAQYTKKEDEFIKDAKFSGVSTFAILHDSKWAEKGDMGWFGCVGNEKEASEWSDIYMKIISEIPDDYYLVVVDCHI